MLDITALRGPYAAITEPRIGLLVAIGEDGCPHVSYAGIAGGLPAPCRVAVPLDRAALGRSVLLLPDPRDGVPIISGVVHDRIETPPPATAQLASEPLVISSDEDELILSAARRISLRCGKASITLDADGHVEIRGQYVLSRAARQNKIKGASVSFN